MVLLSHKPGTQEIGEVLRSLPEDVEVVGAEGRDGGVLTASRFLLAQIRSAGVVTGSQPLILLCHFMSAGGGGGRGHRLLFLLCQVRSAVVEGGRGVVTDSQAARAHSLVSGFVSWC
jgi:hypothetical protein